jgi:ParB family chromosome partitioning protein
MSIDLSQSLDLGDLSATAATGEPLKLWAATIRPSRWANRHELSFLSPEFNALKEEIKNAGGNVQPIKVRPLAQPEDGVEYEVVFGHRRHRACLELGIEVAAVVEAVDDQHLWAQMERENRAREPLSAYEQGTMYQRAMDEGLFPSIQALAKAIGRSAGDISKAISIARLPPEVVQAFGSPQDIGFRDAKPLKDAVEAAPEAVAQAARALAAVPQALPPKVVVQRLAAAAGMADDDQNEAEEEPAEAAVGRSNKAKAAPAPSPAAPAVGPSNKPAPAPKAAPVAHLRVVVEVGEELMELVTDCRPKRGLIPVRPVASDEAPQYLPAGKVRIVRAEAQAPRTFTG